MKLPLVALLAALMAAPVVTIPTYADSQVLTGGGRASPRRPARPAPPRLSEAEEDRMWDAQAEISSLDTQIAAIQTQVQAAGGTTPENAAALNDLTARRAAEQAVFDRMQAKRDR